MKKRVLMVSGEASGDQHGAALVTQVRRMLPEVEFVGMGGEKMRQAGVEIKVDAGPLAVVGAIEVLRHIIPIYRAWKTLCHIISHHPPDLLVVIDYPTFNLMLAKKAKRAGIKVLYYISPQVWAWHRSRIKTIGRRVDKMLVIFPFEEPLYRAKGVPVEYVGHPLAGQVQADKDPEVMRLEWQIPQAERVVGLLPGSRKGEVARLLPIMLIVAAQLKQRYPDMTFILPLANSLSLSEVSSYLAGASVPVRVVTRQFYNAVQLCDVAIVASGTATLETALLQVPMVIVYKVAASTYFLAKQLIKVPFIGLCNIVAGRAVVKELIQDAANPELIAAEVSLLLDDAGYRARVRDGLQEVKSRLGQGGGTLRAAQALIELLK